MVAGDGEASVTITPPITGGSPTSYLVTSFPQNLSYLTNGTSYTFTSTATNAGGTSDASAPSDSVIPQAAPPEIMVERNRELAETGSDPRTLIGITLGFLGAGALTILATLRRRRYAGADLSE